MVINELNSSWFLLSNLGLERRNRLRAAIALALEQQERLPSLKREK